MVEHLRQRKYTAVLIGNDNKNGDGGINAKSTAQINGGTFIAPNNVPAVKKATETGDLSLSGGTFSSDVKDLTQETTPIATTGTGESTKFHVGSDSIVEAAKETKDITVVQGTSISGLPNDTKVTNGTGGEITVNGNKVEKDKTYTVPTKTSGGYYYHPSTPGITAELNGTNKSATDYPGGDYGLVFRSTAAFSTFQGVQVDGKTLAKSNYTAEEGSTVVYLKAAYLKTLAAGKHTITIMSTADISVLTGSASLTKDIYQRYFHPEASEKTLMRVGLAASLFVGVLGAVFGWFTQDIMNILLITFTINSAGLFLPTIGAFFWKKSCSAGAFASMLSATIIAIVWFIGGKVSALPLFSIDALWPSFGVSAVLYVVICLTHRQTPEEQEQAERFYAAR